MKAVLIFLTFLATPSSSEPIKLRNLTFNQHSCQLIGTRSPTNPEVAVRIPLQSIYTSARQNGKYWNVVLKCLNTKRFPVCMQNGRRTPPELKGRRPHRDDNTPIFVSRIQWDYTTQKDARRAIQKISALRKQCSKKKNASEPKASTPSD